MPHPLALTPHSLTLRSQPHPLIPQLTLRSLVLGVVAAWFAVSAGRSLSAELLVGAATVSITPDRPVAVQGQLVTRISQTVENPLNATALAIESREGGKVLDRAILVSCDLAFIPAEALAKTRARLRGRLPDFPLDKVVLSATHTHTCPALIEGIYEIPNSVMQPTEYFDFFAERAAEAAVKAWNARKTGKASWGLGHAVVAHNRRAIYADETAVMYGKTSRPDFRTIEGYEDHTVEVLFFWDGDEKLVATAINVACPAQEVETRSTLNADFWHPVREALRAKYGRDLQVLTWCGAGGDQSPHLMFRTEAEERMRKLRGLDRLHEIGRRIVQAWEEAYAGAKQDVHADVPFVHRVETIELPRREVTEREWKAAKAKVAELSREKGMKTMVWWHGRVVERYEAQQAGPVEPYRMELHVMRLGDVAIVTNSFELFTDYGIQIKGRSPALQTFVIQLAGPGNYLPTGRAVHGGGYSAIAESNEVGPEGGQILVERTIEQINSLWPAKPK